MAMLVGQCLTGANTGLAGRIMDRWLAKPNHGFGAGVTNVATLPSAYRPALAAMCEGIAQAIIDEITANAAVNVSVPNITVGAATASGTGNVS